MRKVLSIILAISALVSSAVGVSADEKSVSVYVDGERVNFDVQPVIENDRLLVPLRAVFEKMGLEVKWSEDVSGSGKKEQRINVYKEYSDSSGHKCKDEVSLTIGSDVMNKITGWNEAVSDSETFETVTLDAPAKIIDDRTLVPLRAISEAFGCVVDWDEEEETVTIVNPADAPDRNIDLSGYEEKTVGNIIIRCPEGYKAYSDPGIDWKQYVLEKNDNTDEAYTMMGFYLGGWPAYGERGAHRSVKGKLFGNDIVWNLYEENYYFDTLFKEERYDEDSAEEYYLNWHVYGYAQSEEERDELIAIAEDARLARGYEENHTSYVSELMSYMPLDENYVISSFSLKMAMMMAANGAEGNTQREILKTFGVNDLDEYNSSAKSIIENLNSDILGNEVHIANSVWFNTDYYKNVKNADFSDSFKEIVSRNYLAGYDVVTDKNIAAKINKWISSETNGKIKDMLNDENIAPSGKKPLLSLVNTVYMKANWQNQFKKSDTKKDIFTDIDGNKKKMDFMSQTDHLLYFNDGETEMVALPYDNTLSMYNRVRRYFKFRELH